MATTVCFTFPFDSRLISNRLSLDYNFTGLEIAKANRAAGTYHSHDTIKELDDASFHLPVGAESDILAIAVEAVN